MKRVVYSTSISNDLKSETMQEKFYLYFTDMGFTALSRLFVSC